MSTTEDARTVENGEERDERPVIFLSHKHVDREIAIRLQDDLQRLFRDGVKIYNTSDARGGGPTEGDSLGASLRAALHETSLVILLYTLDEADWRWCFYECGVANDPLGDVPTKTVVFDFDTEGGSVVFQGDKHLKIAPLDQDGNRRRRAPADFRRFIRELVTTDTYVDVPGDLGLDDLEQDEIFERADEIYTNLLEVGPATQLELADKMTQALKLVPALDRRQSFSPLFTNAASALGWGLDPRNGVRDLFLKYWNKRFVDELETLASRQLVFRPGRVHIEWRRLLRLCRKRIEERGSRVYRLDHPVLALVSDESTALPGPIDPLTFWQQARKQHSDPWWYEDPVRELSRWLREQDDLAGDAPLVERVFVLDRNHFDRELADSLADLITWMGEAGIAVSLTFRNYRSDDDLKHFVDFGLVMDLAVSRFEVDQESGSSSRSGDDGYVDLVAYRSLKADFADKEVERAQQAWAALQESVVWRWNADGACDPDELYEGVMGPTDPGSGRRADESD